MKKLATLSVLAASILFVGCEAIEPGPGEEAVIVKKPYMFGHGGIADKPVVGPALVWAAPSTSEILVNMQPFQMQVHFNDLMSSDSVPFDFDARIGLRVNDSVKLIKYFGAEWYNNNVLGEFQNQVRQAVRKHDKNELASSTAAIDAIDDEVKKGMVAHVQNVIGKDGVKGLPVSVEDVIVGKANPPAEIVAQRVETARQELLSNTMTMAQAAEVKRKLKEESRAAADNAYRLAMGMSPEQFLRLETIKMQQAICAGGKCTVFMGGAPVPTIDVK